MKRPPTTKVPGELYQTPEFIETGFTDGDEPDSTCASCGFGEWRHTPEFNCKQFVSRATPTTKDGQPAGILVQTDYSQSNLAAHELLRECLRAGYTLRIDDLEVTKFETDKVVHLKPRSDVIAERERLARIDEWQRFHREVLDSHYIGNPAQEMANYSDKRLDQLQSQSTEANETRL